MDHRAARLVRDLRMLFAARSSETVDRTHPRRERADRDADGDCVLRRGVDVVARFISPAMACGNSRHTPADLGWTARTRLSSPIHHRLCLQLEIFSATLHTVLTEDCR